MIDTRIQLAALWTALMLVYLLGDVLRIFSGDYLKDDMNISQFTQPMWLGISVLMVIPILMLLVAILLPQPINRWTNLIAAGFFFVFNLVGLPTYTGWYDKFLIVVGLVFNLITIWIAWHWTFAA
jgi:hypothetical protein